MIFQLEGKKFRIFVAEDVRHHVQPDFPAQLKSPPPSSDESEASEAYDLNSPFVSSPKAKESNFPPTPTKSLNEVPIINEIITSPPSAARLYTRGPIPIPDKVNQAQISTKPCEPDLYTHSKASPTISSPIPIQNKFGPLLPNSKTKPKSQTSSTSSLSSGPMFPPGFENIIPTEAKRRHAQKRIRKLQKKNKKKPKMLTSTPPSQPSPLTITTQDVLKLASDLGLRVEGPLSCIENLISAILKRQQEDWDASLQ